MIRSRVIDPRGRPCSAAAQLLARPSLRHTLDLKEVPMLMALFLDHEGDQRPEARARGSSLLGGDRGKVLVGPPRRNCACCLAPRSPDRPAIMIGIPTARLETHRDGSAERRHPAHREAAKQMQLESLAD